MFVWDPDRYGPGCAELLRSADLCPLGPGQPHRNAAAALQSLTPEALVAAKPIVDVDMARCCLAGLWLLHNCLDRSHQISQQIHSSSGSYWHGLMHRREPDFGNAKYWFRRVGSHPVFPTLAQEVNTLLQDRPTPPDVAVLGQQNAWDPFGFIDVCALVLDQDDAAEQVCREIARLEWRILFDFCYARATGE